jgi:uncharacterized protein involved in type VI secretion and phage assembly
MPSIEGTQHEHIARSAEPMYGVYPALVIDIRDPDRQGRVKITLQSAPAAGGSGYTNWARLATFMAGNHRGSWFVPDVNDEVLVAFEGGDISRPYILGSLWNSSYAPPESMDADGANNRKLLRSRSGLTLTLDDQDGAEQMILETPAGQRVTLKDGAGNIVIQDSNGNSVRLDAGGISITSPAAVTVNASTVEVSAGMVTVNAGMSKFSGVVQADTVITNSVISASYSPGAGNIW